MPPKPLALLLPLLVVPLSAQERPAPLPTDAAAYLPATPGTAWEWRVSVTGGKQEQPDRAVTAIVWGSVPAQNGGEGVQIGERHGKRVSWSYQQATGDGLYELSNAYKAGIRGVGGRRTRLLPAPIGSETRWEWEEVTPVQTMAGAPQPDPETLKVRYRSELVALDESITVPAGTYRTLHVRQQSEGRWGRNTTDFFWAPGVGLVRQVDRHGERVQTRELVAFRPGAAAPATVDREAVAQAWAGDDVPLEWLERGHEACYLHGAFVVARPQDGEPRGGWFDGQRVHDVRPDDAAFWSERLLAMDQDLPPMPQAPANALLDIDERDDMGITLVLGTAGRLQAALRGCSEVKSSGSRSESDLAARERKLLLEVYHGARDREGRAVKLTVTASVRGSRVTELKVEQAARDG